jgi:beta-mannosidase
MRTLSLNGKWSLERPGRHKKYSAAVPGDVYGDLLRNKAIPDPYFRDNELDLQWIGETDWIYSRTFNLSKKVLEHDRVLLRCDGLDTLASITINGRVIGRADNMFRTWEFDVKDGLKAGQNTIKIHFSAASQFVRQKREERELPQWGQPGGVLGGNYIRKEQCNFGWDWGPCLVTCGIWRDIYLVAYSHARLADVHISQTHGNKAIELEARLVVEKIRRGRLTARVTIQRGKFQATKKVVLNGKSAGLKMMVKNPELWWPNGMGPQPLYKVLVELMDDSGLSLDTWERKIGLRTLRLDRHEDEWGESFQFMVNGLSFFAKGANWIPAEAILSRLTGNDYERLISDSVHANMNMLRVWGGGIYEDDRFYELCDEYGICIWQDFMFACASYPTFDPDFMKNVRAEAEDNIRRLRHHPSLALWCGNNELEMGLVGDKWTESTMSWTDYKKLFDKLLPDLVAKLDPDHDYWPSSPHSPTGDRARHYNPDCGDAHLWAVWHGEQPFEWYRRCGHRFNSEFGFQSFPEPKTVNRYTVPEDRNVTTYIMEHHQRSNIGNTTIMRYMLDWFRLPKNFEMTLWLSQILQGMAMKYACEHWRRSMPRGMGTLYWQLNDCWPVASWASIDSFGRWKALHYMARNFFNPILVSGLENNERAEVEIHLTSDLRKAMNVQVEWTLTTVRGNTLAEGSKKARGFARQSRPIQTLKLKKYIQEHSERDLMLWLELSAHGKNLSTNFVSFSRPKHLELRPPGITTKIRFDQKGAFIVKLKAKRPALWTWLELDGLDAEFSDNFFHLRPGKEREIQVKPGKRIDAAQFKKRLKVRSLIDTY